MAAIPVLLIDDDPVLADLLKGFLKDHDFDLHCAGDPDAGLKLLKSVRPRLVILDVMLPERDGFTVIQEIRRHSSVPVVMLTARGETLDKILGLELGADDYLSKPFEPRELVARLKAILKRSSSNPTEKLISGDLTVDPVQRTLTVSGKALELTTLEFELILLLVRNPGRKFTRDELLSLLRGEEIEAFGRAIDNLISRVRRKLAKTANSGSIQTVWGTGYVYIEPGEK